MYKKFLLTFIFCLGVFGTTAFAYSTSEMPPVDNSTFINNGSDMSKNNYVIMYDSINSMYLIFYSSNSFSSTSTSVLNTPSKTYVAGFTDGKWSQWGGEDSNRNLISSYKFVYTNKDIGDGSTVFFSKIPPLSEVTKTQMKVFQTDFLIQLKKLLPIGVTILAIILGVSLIPRLVHLFL